MTIIEPNKNKNLIIRIILIFLPVFLSGTFGLVALYNQSVNLDYRINQINSEIKKFELANTQIKDEVYRLTSAVDFEKISLRYNLIKDNNPKYLEVALKKSENRHQETKQWEFASQY